MKTHYTILILYSSLFISLLGCNKNQDQAPAPGPDQKCLLQKKIAGDGNVAEYSYDVEGRLQRINYSSSAYTLFSYIGNVITSVRYTNKGKLYERILSLNNNGTVANIRQNNFMTETTGNPSWANWAYTYNGTEVREETYTYADISGGPSDDTRTTSYTWLNGNLAQKTDQTWEESYAYYPDQIATEIADINLLAMNGSGGLVIKNQNLLKSRETKQTGGSNRTVTTYTYEFDAMGKLISKTSISKPDGNTNSEKYEYDCP